MSQFFAKDWIGEPFKLFGSAHLIALVVVLCINLAVVLIGSNYLFIARKPDTASLIDVLGPWPWYILSIEVMGVVVCLILYLLFAIRNWRARAVTAK